MRHALLVLAVVLVAAVALAPAASAQTKWVRGNVAAMGTDTITVKVADKDMTFTVDKATELIARGAGTAQRQEGGVAFGKFVKVGEGIEVTYKEVAGKMMATELRPLPGPVQPATGGAAAATGKSARGTVTAVEAATISVKGDEGTVWKFAVDAKTNVIGRGAGTLTREKEQAGQKPTLADFIGANDLVMVYFEEAAGTMTAKEIRVIRKAPK